MTDEVHSCADAVSRIESSVRTLIGGRIQGLEVYSESDRVVLTGSTSEYYHKQLATHAAQDASDGQVLANEIVVVREPKSQAIV